MLYLYWVVPAEQQVWLPMDQPACCEDSENGRGNESVFIVAFYC